MRKHNFIIYVWETGIVHKWGPDYILTLSYEESFIRKKKDQGTIPQMKHHEFCMPIKILQWIGFLIARVFQECKKRKHESQS